jgi:hypothetical protein
MKYNLTERELGAQLNSSIRQFMEGMRKEGILSMEEISKMNKYAIVVSEHGSLGRFWDKLWGDSKTKDSLITIVKIIE